MEKLILETRIPKIGEAVFAILEKREIGGLPIVPEIIRIGKVIATGETHHDLPVLDLWTNRNEITGKSNKIDLVNNLVTKNGFSNAFIYLYQLVPIWN